MSSLRKKILIWDVVGEAIDTAEYDAIILWQSYEQNSKKNVVSIPRLIQDNSDEIKEQYLSFIYKLGEASIKGKRVVEHLEVSCDFSYWWMTLLTEKCNFAKTPQIDNIIKVMSFKDWLNVDELYDIKLVSSNNKLNLAISELSLIQKYNYKWEEINTNNSSILKNIYVSIPNIIKAPIWLIRYLKDNWQLKGVGIDGWKETSATLSFVSYFFHLDSKEANKSNYSSRYWTKLPEMLSQYSIKSNWLHIYVSSDAFPLSYDARIAVDGFNDKYLGKQNHVFLQSFITTSVILKTIYVWIAIALKYKVIKSGIRHESSELWWLLEDDLKDSLVGVTAISNLLFYKLFCEAMVLLPPQKRGVYLQENQGWESGLIDAWSRYGHSNNLIGMPHSTLSYWDLRFYFDKRTYNKTIKCPKPLPNLVAVNGKNTRDKYLSWGYPKDDIIKVEALRYLNLIEQKYKIGTGEVPEITNNITVLVLGDYMKVNTDKLMKLLQEADQLSKKNIKYIVKPHPMCPIDKGDYSDLNIKITNNMIHMILDECDIAISSMSTSASVDVYITGKPVVIYLDERTLATSPLTEDDGIAFVTTGVDFEKIISGANKIEFKDDQGKDYFYLDENLTKWRELLVEDHIINQTNLERVK